MGDPLPGIQRHRHRYEPGRGVGHRGALHDRQRSRGRPQRAGARHRLRLVDRRRSTSSPARRRRVNFSLTPAAAELNPIVVDGYGEQERRIVTGAVSTVQAAQLKDIPTSDPMKALQGHVAGVEIVASSNEPGAAMNVRIRGVRSLTASNEPLYVVDGIPLARRHSGLQPGR